jgi:hypothetical protein
MSDKALEFDDDVKATFGDGGDLEIFHDGSHSYIKDEGTGELKLTSDGNGVVLLKGTSENLARFLVDGACELYYDDSKKIETKTDGILVAGEVQSDTLDCNGNAHIDGNCTVTGAILQGDSDYHYFGSDNDMQFFHNGDHGYIKNGTGRLHIGGDDVGLLNNATNEFYFQGVANGAASLYYDAAKKLETTADGVAVTGGQYTGELALKTNDGVQRGRIYSSSGSWTTFQSGHNETYMQYVYDAGVEIYYNAVKKFETTSDGIKLTAGDNALVVDIGGATRMQLVHSSGGNVTWSNPSSGTATYSTSSDYRLKQDVVALPNAWSTVKALKPYEYKWKHDTSTTSQGFFAHEVITTIPNSQAAQGTKDAVDGDGNPVYQQIDYSKLVPVLTKALQEAITEIETLKTKVAALEAA